MESRFLTESISDVRMPSGDGFLISHHTIQNKRPKFSWNLSFWYWIFISYKSKIKHVTVVILNVPTGKGNSEVLMRKGVANPK